MLIVFITLMASTIGLGVQHSSKISNIMDLLIQSKALLKSINMKTESRLQKLHSSLILCRVSIWFRVERPALKPPDCLLVEVRPLLCGDLELACFEFWQQSKVEILPTVFGG